VLIFICVLIIAFFFVKALGTSTPKTAAEET
jgi:hypothetical protein